MCFRGGPRARCESYTVFEVSGVMTTGFLRRELGGCAKPTAACSSSGMANGYYAWNVGGMRNLWSRGAVGAAIEFGETSFDEIRFAPQARGRVWLTPRLSVDAAAGLLLLNGGSVGTGTGLTGDVMIGVGDLVAVSFGGDAVNAHRRAFHAGIRLGSYAAIPGSIFATLALAEWSALRGR